MSGQTAAEKNSRNGAERPDSEVNPLGCFKSTSSSGGRVLSKATQNLRVLFTVATIFLIAGGTANADFQTDGLSCYDSKTEPKTRIKACTSVLVLGKLPYDISSFLYMIRANTYTEIGQTDAALRDYNRSIQIDPNNFMAHFNRGRFYSVSGKYDQAIVDFDKGLEINSSFAPGYKIRGQTYGKMGQYDKSIRDLNQAIQLDPKDAHAFNARADTYNKSKQYILAIKDYSRAIELAPQVAYYFANRGNTYRKIGEYDWAIEDNLHAMKLDPDHFHAYYSQGRVMLCRDRYYEAISFLDMAIKRTPNRSQDFAYLAMILATVPDVSLRNGPRAVELAQQALEFKNTYFERDILASALAETGQFKKAVKEQQRAIDMFPSRDGMGSIDDYRARLKLYKNKKTYRFKSGKHTR
jgi:tetratricopeptide (TPR) repeat protein